MSVDRKQAHPQDDGDEVLTLSPCWQPVAVRGSILILASEDAAITINHPSALQVVTALVEGASPNDLRIIDGSNHVLEQLRAAGVLERGPIANRSAEAYWQELGARPGSIAWRQLTEVAIPAIEAVLDQHGVSVRDDGDVVLVTTDDYLHPDLPEIARHEDRPWLLARPVGRVILLGPLFTPESVPCWFCLAHWLKMRRWVQGGTTGWDDDDVPPQPGIAALAGTTAFAAGWIATAITALSAQRELPYWTDTIQSFDLVSFRFDEHRVRQAPRCSRCTGQRSPVATHPRDWLDRLIGIADDLRVTADCELGAYHAQCRYYYPLPRPRARMLMAPGIAYGRGSTRDHAVSGCTAEAIERYSSAWQGDEDVRRGTLASVGGIDPAALLHFSTAQYRDRLGVEQRYGADHSGWVPYPFDPAAETDWVKAESLTSSEAVWIPAAFCYMGYPVDGEHRFCVGNTNGVAAGESLREALSSALLEIVERDAIAIWWHNRIRRPALNVRILDSPDLARVCDTAATLGISIALLDVTTDVRIPVCAAVATNEAGELLAMGSAAHPNPTIAATRAASELSQMWFWGNQDDSPRTRQWFRNMSRASDPYLEPAGTTDLPASAMTFDDCLEAIAAVGLSAYWVDLTRPEIGVPVVRVVIPEMRHCWNRLAPGRLYDVPVRLGWQRDHTPEEQMNPRFCPI